MKTPLIDVLVPVYNAGRTVEAALASIQTQSIDDIRLVVVDDGSTDDTPQILDRLKASDPRLNVIRQDNAGIVGALNTGLAACRADLVARHDADDLAYPTRFATQLDYLARHPDCIAVSNAIKHIDEAGKLLGTVGRPIAPDRADPRSAPSIEPYLMHPFLMVRRDAMQKIGGYRYVEHAEDTDLYWRLREIGRLHNLGEVLGEYRVHTQSISGQSVVAGRVSAISAQLAAISARRRMEHREDLVFDKLSDRYRAARSYDDLFELADRGLTATERDYLRIALAGKMLELTSYRPYDLEIEDCRFIRSALDRHTGLVSNDNRRALARQCSGTAAGLVQRGRIREARILVPPSAYASTAARLAIKLALPRSFRTALRHALGR